MSDVIDNESVEDWTEDPELDLGSLDDLAGCEDEIFALLSTCATVDGFVDTLERPKSVGPLRGSLDAANFESAPPNPESAYGNRAKSRISSACNSSLSSFELHIIVHVVSNNSKSSSSPRPPWPKRRT